ncbi:MAG: pyruvate dehydrogenase complex dihydrolipoamide acetyltransferase [Chitinophagaceae bacterium]|nr:pyruvate dehydrogenase complex dihydrolipoamide acetyltransferase [Chitinophagaceae bacterium]
MAELIKMPRLSDTMTEGVIAAWHKKVGDTVKKGELLAEVETDKATMELESYKDGVILHLGAPAGGKLQVDDLLVIVGNAGEDISGLLAGAAAPAPAAAAPAPTAAPAAQPAAGATLDLNAIEEVVLMPRLSDTMTEGVIANWVKKVGDKVSKGDVLAEIETDKATMELESYKNGVLLYQGANAGDKIQVNDLLAIIGAADFKIDEIVAAAKSGGGAASAPAPAAAEAPAAAPVAAATPAPAVAAQPEVVNTGRILASPLARKLAAEKGIDLRYVKGSGDNGRITKSDIDQYTPVAAPAAAAPVAAAPAAPTPAAPAVAPFVPGGQGEGYTDNPNSQMRKVIAKRLSESKFTAPHFYLKMEINMDNAMAARTKLNEVSPVKISFNDMIIKAAAMALKKHPAVNSSWMGEFIRTYEHVHIGMAVAIPDGLIVPVIRFADQKTLSQIAAEAKELGGKAKGKKLQPHEFTGNTFTISNLGMMDIDEFTAIVNPPDSCILAVGKIKEEVYRTEKGEFAVRNIMKLTLSCDHRSVDGAVGAAFLQTLKAYLENPVTMLV